MVYVQCWYLCCAIDILTSFFRFEVPVKLGNIEVLAFPASEVWDDSGSLDALVSLFYGSV